MKNVAKSLMIAGALVAAGSASAEIADGFSPTFGVDYQHVWMKGKNFPGASLFPKSYPGATIYIGNKFTEYFGVELGFDWSKKVKKDWNLAANAGANILAMQGTTKISRTGGHLDLIGYLPMNECIDLFASVGYGMVFPKITTTITSTIPGGDAAAQRQASALQTIAGKAKGVWRLGVGASLMATEMFGLRAKLGWESTSNLKLKTNAAFDTLKYSNKAFKSSMTMAVGAFVKF